MQSAICSLPSSGSTITASCFLHTTLHRGLCGGIAWIADTRLAAGPVVFYAAIFVLVNFAFLGYQQEALSQASDREVSTTTRHLTWVRALITLAIFLSAACVAYCHPLSGFDLVCCVLLIYLRPQVPGEGLGRHAERGT
jgi:uncharacterized membrane protein YiaA